MSVIHRIRLRRGDQKLEVGVHLELPDEQRAINDARIAYRKFGWVFDAVVETVPDTTDEPCDAVA